MAITEEAVVVSPHKPPKDVPEGTPWNAVEDAFLRRRSIRKYKKKQVPEHYIKRILEVARYAPSQGNCQPWKFIVVQDPKMIAEMEEFGSNMMQAMGGGGDAKPGADPPPGMHPVPYRLITQSPPDPDRGIGLFHGAPTIIFPAMDSRGIGHPEIDLGIVGTNIVMAAYSLGLGSCWVGFAEFLNAGGWAEKLGIEEPFKLIEGITIGFPVGDPHHNQVNREVHATTWFDTEGNKRTVY